MKELVIVKMCWKGIENVCYYNVDRCVVKGTLKDYNKQVLVRVLLLLQGLAPNETVKCNYSN